MVNHQADSGVHHTKGAMGVGESQVQHVSVEVVSTSRAVMLRVGNLQGSRPFGHRAAQIMERSLDHPQPIGPVSAPGTGASSRVAGPPNDLWRGKILDTYDANRGIGSIISRSIREHISMRPFSRRYRPLATPKGREFSLT